MRRSAALVLLLLLVAAGCTAAPEQAGRAVPSRAVAPDRPATEAPAAWLPTEAERQAARAAADRLTLEELAGQLIIARHFDDASSLALVRDRHFAGVMVTGDRILDVATTDPLQQITDFNTRLQEAGAGRGYPVLVPIDQEGGLVTRLRSPLTGFPSFMSAGAAITGDPSAATVVTAAARAAGAELRAAGFNAVFAPVADVTVGTADPIIGSRSPSSDPAVVASTVTAAVSGYGEAGLMSTVKHFPGHNVDEDSHRSLPELDSDRTRLREHDLRPFKEAIAAGAPAIMTGHLDVTLIDAGVPASLSRKVITDGLRANLGYEGIVISDSLGMGAVNERYRNGTAAVEAIKAGSDLALMPADNVAAHEAMLAALRSGDLDEEQARASAARVIAQLTHDAATTALPGEPGSHDTESARLSAAALTLVTCDAITPVTSVTPVGDPESVRVFSEVARARGLPLGGGTLVAFAGPGGAVRGDVAVSVDTPYALARSVAPTKIALYGRTVGAMHALAAVLTGKRAPRGALPVEVPGLRACD